MVILVPRQGPVSAREAQQHVVILVRNTGKAEGLDEPSRSLQTEMEAMMAEAEAKPERTCESERQHAVILVRNRRLSQLGQDSMW